MRVLALLHGIAAVLRRVHQFTRKARRHRLLRAGARSRDQPADGECLGALRTNFDGDLVGRTADAPGTDFDARLHIVERIMENADRIALHSGFDIVESAIDNTFGDRLLAVEHDRIHELRQDDIPELRVGEDFALLRAATTSHWTIPFSSACSGTRPGLTQVDYLGRLAPYLERDCLRSLTPCVSRTPRSTW